MDATMWWIVAIAIVQILTIVLMLKGGKEISKEFDRHKEYIDLSVKNTFEHERRKVWWADREVMQQTLRDYVNEWSRAYVEFRDKTDERLHTIEEQLVTASEEWEAKYDLYLRNMNTAADDIGEIRDRCLELQKANTVLMRTILERMPLPVQPTSPKRKARS